MYETDAEVARLQELLDRSLAGSTDHLKAIIHGDRVLTAADLVALLTGMKVLSAATVTAGGEPRVQRARRPLPPRHLELQHQRHIGQGTPSGGPTRRSVSPTSTGRSSQCSATATRWPCRPGTLAGTRPSTTGSATTSSSPLDWGPDVRLYDYRPHWMVGYAFNRVRLLRKRGLDPAQP